MLPCQLIFVCFSRFYQGRRTEDDERQISRWKKCAGVKGRWRNNLITKVVFFFRLSLSLFVPLFHLLFLCCLMSTSHLSIYLLIILSLYVDVCHLPDSALCFCSSSCLCYIDVLIYLVSIPLQCSCHLHFFVFSLIKLSSVQLKVL